MFDDASKCKPKYPSPICEEDHYTKDCPHRAEFSRLLKGTQGTPIVLKEPFQSHQTQLVEQPQYSTSSGSQVYMSGKTPIFVASQQKTIQLLPSRWWRKKLLIHLPLLLHPILVLFILRDLVMTLLSDHLLRVSFGNRHTI